MMKNILSLLVVVALNIGFASAQIVSEKVYKVTSKAYPNKVFMGTNSSLDTNVDMVMWTDTDVNAQRWLVKEVADGQYNFYNAYSNMSFRPYSAGQSGTKVIQAGRTGIMAFRWSLEAAPGVPNGYYIINEGSTTKICLGAPSDTDGAILTASLKKTPADDKQIWIFEEVKDYTNDFTLEMREAMVASWKAKYLKKTPNRNGMYLALSQPPWWGFWGDAENMEVILDAYETTGNPLHKEMFMDVYNNFIVPRFDGKGTDWSWNEFNDDIMWMVLSCVRASTLFANTSFLTLAKANFDKVYARGLFPATHGNAGMMRWKEASDTQNGANSCINGPTIVAACYLAEATGDMGYYEKAKNLYAAHRAAMFENASTTFNGKVYDSRSWNPTAKTYSYNHWASTYNQGTSLGAAVMLFNHYGTEQYRTDAKRIFDFTLRDMCDSHNLIKVCETPVNGDLSGFKGIFMRYARRYITDICPTDYKTYSDFMITNAKHVYNNRNSAGLTWTIWRQKATERFSGFADVKDDDGKVIEKNKEFFHDSFGAGTAVSAAVNAPLDPNRIVKDAYDYTRAEEFNYLRGITTETSTFDPSQRQLSTIREGYWTAYYNMDFGTKEAKYAFFNVASSNSAKIEIRLGAVDGTLIGTAEISNTGGVAKWKQIACELKVPTKGRQNIYLIYRKVGSSTGDLFKLYDFAFATSNVAPPTGMETVDTASTISVYPNPAVDYVTVETESAASVSLYSLSGTLMFSQAVDAGQTTIALDNCPAGVYLVKVVREQGTETIKLIKR